MPYGGGAGTQTALPTAVGNTPSEDGDEGSPSERVTRKRCLAQPEVWLREGILGEEGCDLSSISEGDPWVKSRRKGSRWRTWCKQRLSVNKHWVAMAEVRWEGSVMVMGNHGGLCAGVSVRLGL